MRLRNLTTKVVLASMLVTACGIATSPERGLADDIEDAAQRTAALDTYDFAWTAEYELSESDSGRSDLIVTGSGFVDAAAGAVDTVVTYDDELLDAARSLFPDDALDEVQAFTKVIGAEVYVRGFNTASLPAESAPRYDTWYEISRRSQDLGDPFVTSDVLPADVLPVIVAPLVESGETSVVVDRDFVLDLGTRFPRSLYDFGFRIGGGDFVISIELDDGRIDTVVIDGDDPGSGVDRFTFTIRISPSTGAVIEPPSDAVPLR